MQTENQSSKPDPVAKQGDGSALRGAACSPSSSETPESDENVASIHWEPGIYADADFARKLERQRNEWRDLACKYAGRIGEMRVVIKEARRIQSTDAPAYEQLNQLRAILFPENAERTCADPNDNNL
jgi:hypothetical protein